MLMTQHPPASAVLRLQPTPSGARPLSAALRAAACRFFLWLLDRQERARQRRHLLALSDRALADLALSRADAEREAETVGRM
ncbi:MAG: DUF1127 domain-containing protein [Alphaproteobacteria bacterium]|nr:DUF1127 domain-containing protein [Alphaproteobacteria bacterium]